MLPNLSPDQGDSNPILKIDIPRREPEILFFKVVSRITFVSTITPSKMKGTTKGRLIRDRGKMYDHSRFIISSAAMSKSKIRF